jgi:hypothetical protein
MPYADAVIRETLRVAPPSAAVFRRALVDLEVRVTFHLLVIIHIIQGASFVTRGPGERKFVPENICSQGPQVTNESPRNLPLLPLQNSAYRPSAASAAVFWRALVDLEVHVIYLLFILLFTPLCCCIERPVVCQV